MAACHLFQLWRFPAVDAAMFQQIRVTHLRLQIRRTHHKDQPKPLVICDNKAHILRLQSPLRLALPHLAPSPPSFLRRMARGRVFHSPTINLDQAPPPSLPITIAPTRTALLTSHLRLAKPTSIPRTLRTMGMTASCQIPRGNLCWG